jgi:hypothetical protein
MAMRYTLIHGIRIGNPVFGVYGHLTAIGGRSIKVGKRPMTVCKCDCGEFAFVRVENLVTGNTNSCGCKKAEALSRGVTFKPTHGRSTTTEFKTWMAMKQRCNDKNAANYPQYGGAGVRVFSEWMGENGFIAFYQHIGPRPSDGHSLDRIDPFGNYEPGNVRWATAKQQSNNRRETVKIEFCGMTKTMPEWAEFIGVRTETIYSRRRKGWSVERILRPSKGVVIRTVK